MKCTEELNAIIDANREACLQEFSTIGIGRCWVILATSDDEDALTDWLYTSQCPVELFNRRGNTARCRVWIPADAKDDRACLRKAYIAATGLDVTLQLLCAHGPIEGSERTHDLGSGSSCTIREIEETYPLLHLADHGLKWPPAPASPDTS